MKLTLEKEEVQLLGQLASEISAGRFDASLLISAALLWEFKTENAAAFEQPQRIRRKVKMSTFLALKTYLKLQHARNDIWWDMTLRGLIDKLEKMGKEPAMSKEKTLLT